ncbi:homocitrate synthase NifV [Clostridium beijerinckii]|uniref:homocitrate synthase/isopropylmalate synthase family protein n=1 Tax=Clostridium beijerinckii TaxID=1520 RepID=UPI001494CF41|nr:isopropylmalate synthase [Clostridium beijerinckii]NOW91955.1 homocitrate synthase NifV [Clostridium beijerinckii]
MDERKIEIIDRTIIVLREIFGDKLKEKSAQVRELIKLLYIIGSDYIEITQELYEELSPLPQDVKFIISNNNKIEIESVNVLYEILDNKLNIYNKMNARIVGLDDIIFYDYQQIFLEIIKFFGNNIELSIKNNYKSATAMSLEWVKAGGKKVVTTFAGIGGFAPLQEILGGSSFLEKIKDHSNYKLFPKVLSIFEYITESKIRGNAPFIGKDIFNVESGIHVNGIAKDSRTFEPYDPSEIGRKRNIIIGKHSSVNALEIKLEELNIKYEHDNLTIMLEDVRKLSTQKRGGLSNDEIKRLYKKLCV